MARRSTLYTPGDEPDMMRKSLKTDADAVVFDLEDAVAPSEKAYAREAVAEMLSETDTDTELGVRVNTFDTGGATDVQAIVGGDSDPDMIALPMVESVEETVKLGALLEAADSDALVTAIVETGRGLVNAPEIAASEYVDVLGLGAEDLAAEVGATRTPEGEEILYSRQQVVTAAASGGVSCLDTVYTEIGDHEGLRSDTERAVQFGFDGKIAIHPSQVGPINEAFTPPADRIEWARKVLEAEREATDSGKGVFEVDGQMIDPPLIAQAQRVVDLAEAAGEL
ncbi:HpcH/HpaI aldolase/citrate lyase family protein [Natronorubrum sp. FCH18a]|uniref:HpcH/HpaI aldolase/citrate lyase family protein n=1 Tax=Natronorubrum sp. FCH18a TaxID=3447018 RepID=UPI003F512405